MDKFVSFDFQVELLIRLLIAAFCGALVGYERKRRQKEAGIRTHIMVAMGAALFAMVSKYGFLDVVFLDSVQVDASRVASNIVTGVCFLGAGMIFIRNRSISGLTTAAGIWAVSGIGLSFGTGLYAVGGSATFIILFIQFLLHRPLQWVEGPSVREINCVIINEGNNVEDFIAYLKSIDKAMYISQIEKYDNGTIMCTFHLRVKKKCLIFDTYELLKVYPYIKSIRL